MFKIRNAFINQESFIRIDIRHVLEKDVKNLASKQTFTRCKLFSVFDFKIEFIEGESNSLLDFLTREHYWKMRPTMRPMIRGSLSYLLLVLYK